MVVSTAPAAGQEMDPTDLLLRRVGDAVQGFVDNLTNVVAEEEYRQQFRNSRPQRRLRSDFLLVGYPQRRQGPPDRTVT